MPGLPRRHPGRPRHVVRQRGRQRGDREQDPREAPACFQRRALRCKTHTRPSSTSFGLLYARDAAVSKRSFHPPRPSPTRSWRWQRWAPEGVCELIATNEERLLQVPHPSRRFYKNPACRMSTADRLLEPRSANNIELNIPPSPRPPSRASLIAEPMGREELDDEQFEARRHGQGGRKLRPEDGEDHPHRQRAHRSRRSSRRRGCPRDPGGAVRPRRSASSRLATLKRYYDDRGREISESATRRPYRMLGVRDANLLVASRP